jgi:hypothetical protein
LKIALSQNANIKKIIFFKVGAVRNKNKGPDDSMSLVAG